MESAINYMNQMITSVKTPTGRNARPFFRNATTYMNFNTISLSLYNSLVSINKNFKNIINNIGFVEPDDMNTYKETFTNLIDYYNKLILANTFRGQLHFKIHDTTAEPPDLRTLYDRFNSMNNEIQEIKSHNNKIDQTYNYKSANVKSTPKAKNFKLSKHEDLSSSFIDDDE